MIKYDIKIGNKIINNCNVKKHGRNHYSIIVDKVELLKIGDAMILILAKYIDNVAVEDFVPYRISLEELWKGDMEI